MKIHLLQARRDDDPMRDHEQQCFADATGLGRDAFRFVNVVEGVPSMAEVVASDALMIGGAGHYSVTEPDEPFFAPLNELLRNVVDERFPTFASCFGFQLLVSVLGGRVEQDPAGSEVGSFGVRLTEAGRRDELFGGLPGQFVAQMGHKDRATVMPAGVPNLAASERCALQALRIPGAPIWATQFHPELDERTNRDRYLAYIDRYDPARRGEGASGFTALPSPETSTLLPRFINLIRST
jgi:GMP synthase (glutamine-hydrolysing)